MASFHVRPSRRLFMAAPTLKTNDVNQKPFTLFASALSVWPYENCIVVAVTAEKNVATVVTFSKFAAAYFCDERMLGTPASNSMPKIRLAS